MSIICMIFGHKLPSTTAQVMAVIDEPAFRCRECGQPIKWNTMPRQVRSMRKEYLVRTGRGDIVAKELQG